MLWIFILLFSFFTLIGLPAQAQAQMLTVNLGKATMSFTWSQGTGATADGSRWKCGPATGNYTVVTDVADPASRSVAVVKVIKGAGTWFCVVAMYNAFGESELSNEVNFIAGVPPFGSITLTPPQ